MFISYRYLFILVIYYFSILKLYQTSFFPKGSVYSSDQHNPELGGRVQLLAARSGILYCPRPAFWPRFSKNS